MACEDVHKRLSAGYETLHSPYAILIKKYLMKAPSWINVKCM